MAIRSERMRKFEKELADLEQWLKLGLVPKKNIEKHKEEIEALRTKIKDEKERLQFLKETDEVEEYVTPKTSASSKPAFSDVASMNDLDNDHHRHSNFDSDSDNNYLEPENNNEKEERGGSSTEETEYDPFSDAGRSRRNGWDKYILDPDSDDW